MLMGSTQRVGPEAVASVYMKTGTLSLRNEGSSNIVIRNP
jgi:hypothetical protein